MRWPVEMGQIPICLSRGDTTGKVSSCQIKALGPWPIPEAGLMSYDRAAPLFTRFPPYVRTTLIKKNMNYNLLLRMQSAETEVTVFIQALT